MNACDLTQPNDPRMIAVAVVICAFCLATAVLLRWLRK